VSVMHEENPTLWQGQGSAPTVGSVLRTRRFWRQLYRLRDEHDPDAFAEIYEFDFYVTRPNSHDGRSLVVRSAPDATLLKLRGASTQGEVEIGRVDESVTEPHTFRWSEVQTLARYFVRRETSPINPSIALLLLAPFVGGVDDDRRDLQATLTAELAKLELLSGSEIADVIEHRLVSTYGIASYERIWWAADPVVGWRLDGIPRESRHEGWLPGYSLRTPSVEGFPAADFVALLRDAGVDDV